MGPAVPVPPCLGLRVVLRWRVGGEPGSQGRGRGREAGPKWVGLQGLEAKNTGKPALSVHRTLWVPGIVEP